MFHRATALLRVLIASALGDRVRAASIILVTSKCIQSRALRAHRPGILGQVADQVLARGLKGTIMVLLWSFRQTAHSIHEEKTASAPVALNMACTRICC